MKEKWILNLYNVILFSMSRRKLTMHEIKENSGKGCLIALRFWKRNKRGQSAIEFTAMLFFIIGTLLYFQKYIARGLYGRWKGVGDAMGQGRIYDPNYTTQCEYHPSLGWFDRTCFDACSDGCGPPSAPNCSDCVTSCITSRCTN